MSRTKPLSKVAGKLRRLGQSLDEAQARPDDLWALAHLSPAEGRVYLSLDARDRAHACRVAQALLRPYPDRGSGYRESEYEDNGYKDSDYKDNELLAAALLHDCGKAARRYRVHERVLAGLVPHWAMPYLSFGAVQVRLHHPEYGAQMVREAGGREAVAALIAQHHHPGDNVRAQRLHQLDEME